MWYSINLYIIETWYSATENSNIAVFQIKHTDFFLNESGVGESATEHINLQQRIALQPTATLANLSTITTTAFNIFPC